MYNAALPLAPGQFRFRLVRQLGAGGLGVVDEIEIVESNGGHPVGSHWARKRLNDQWKAHPDHQERFEREIRAMQKMSHSNIVPYEGENLPGGERFYVMPLYTQSLRDLMVSPGGACPWREVAVFGAGLADALHYAHQNGFIHRDLKPENILIGGANRYVIADWGLGRFVHQFSKVLQPLTRAGLGTQYYCAAEQWANGDGREPADIYSLGMMLAELGMGRAVDITYAGMGIQTDVVTGNSTGSIAFNAIIRKMTALAASARYASMNQVADALRAAVAAG